MADPYLSNVCLQILANGTAGATTFQDSSPLAATVTTYGTASVSTTSPPIGTGFLSLGGGASGLSVPNNNGFNLRGAGGFTIEMFINIGGTNQDFLVLDYADDDLSTGWSIWAGGSGNLTMYVPSGSLSLGSAGIRNAGWKHVEFAYDPVSGYIRGFVNGVKTSEVGYSHYVETKTTGALHIGRKGNATASTSAGLIGGIDCLRITDGVCPHTANFTVPNASDFGDTSLGGTSATAAVTMPVPAVSASLSGSQPLPGATMNAVMPKPVVSGSIIVPASAAVQAIMPMPMVKAATGANVRASMPLPIVSASGTVMNMANVAAVMPSPLVAATGRVAGALVVAAKMPMPTVTMYGGIRSENTLQGRFAVSASVLSGSVLRVAAAMPMPKASAVTSQRNRLSVAAAMPMLRMVNSAAAQIVMPGFALNAALSAVVTVTYEAYALNLKHNAETPDELTRYTNFPFDRIVRYQNSYYGMNSTGLYLLEGTTDFAEPTPTPIPWSWKTAMTDFGTTQLQTIRYAYFGGRMAPAATIAIHFGDTASESYAYSTPRDTSAQNYRQEFGRGIQSRYYAFSGQGEGELSLDSINFIIAKSARKV